MNLHGQAINRFSVLLTDTTAGEEVIVEVQLTSRYVTPLANGWVHVSVPLAQLNPKGVRISSVQLKNYTATTLGPIHVDDLQFVP